MQKVAIFGKPGSGKSTLSSALADATQLPLHPLDLIEFKVNGERVPREEFDQRHRAILKSDRWIIDGMGHFKAFSERLIWADTLIFIDLPYSSCYWFVTKRFLKGMFVKPKGWPEGCSVLTGTLSSYKTLRMCPEFWNDSFTHALTVLAENKTLHIIRSVKELNQFLQALQTIK